MEFTCAVWFEGALAHYHVLETGTNTFNIRLLNSVTKTTQCLLPRKISICKKGEEWISDHQDQQFIDDLVGTITANKMNGALLDF